MSRPWSLRQRQYAKRVVGRKLRATTDYADAVPEADVVVLVVPLFVDAEANPDFGWMDAATAELAKHLTPGTLVSYETTLPVGTTRSRWKGLAAIILCQRESFSPRTGKTTTGHRFYLTSLQAGAPLLATCIRRH